MGGRVPGHQRFPDVVVGLVAMLVVGGIEIGEIEGAQRRTQGTGVAAYRRSWSIHQLRNPQLQRIERAGRPLLDVGHLHAGGGVHPVGGFEEAREQDRFDGGALVVHGDGVAHGVDALAVVRLKETRLPAKRLGDVAGSTGPCVQLVDDARQGDGVDARGIDLHVTTRQHRRAPGAVDSGDASPLGLEGLGHAGGTGEHVESGGGPAAFEQRGEHGDEATLGPQVLDHGATDDMAVRADARRRSGASTTRDRGRGRESGQGSGA